MIPSKIAPQYLMEANADTILLWREMAEEMATQGGETADQARRFQLFCDDAAHRNDLWRFATTLNLALGACAYQVPADDDDGRQVIAEMTQAHPELAWILRIERDGFDFREINPDLSDEALDQAKKRLAAWLG